MRYVSYHRPGYVGFLFGLLGMMVVGFKGLLVGPDYFTLLPLSVMVVSAISFVFSLSELLFRKSDAERQLEMMMARRCEEHKENCNCDHEDTTER